MPRSSPLHTEQQARRKPAMDEPAGRRAALRDSLTGAPGIPAIAILPLRLFLGITFVYAGWQKLTDPGFFKLGSGSYIGSQILAYSRGSPIHDLLQPALEHAVAVGVLTVVTELALGALVLAGLFTRPAALVGLVLNLSFFLSASWHTYPYFMGADIVWVMCWLTLALTGPGPFALDAIMQEPLGRRLRRRAGTASGTALQRLLTGPLPGKTETSEGGQGSSPSPRQLVVSRTEVVLGGITAFTLVLLGLAPRGSISGAVANKPTGSGAATPPPGASKGTSGPGYAAGTPAGYRKIGNISQLPANSAGMVTDPTSGDPAIVVHTSGSEFYAYDAVCTHAGCTVQYDPQSKLIVCPCHGGAFDPTRAAEVVSGPPPSPLAQLSMKIDAQGNIYLA